jgi:tetratricopeptide (TPR) repeat protein
MRSIDTCI